MFTIPWLAVDYNTIIQLQASFYSDLEAVNMPMFLVGACVIVLSDNFNFNSMNLPCNTAMKSHEN